MGGIVLAMLIFSFCVLFMPANNPGGGTLVVKQNGVVLDRVVLPLSEKYERTVNSSYGYNTIMADESGAYIHSADCANQNCVHSAPIKNAGQRIVCLPHRLELYIEGENTGLDSIAG